MSKISVEERQRQADRRVSKRASQFDPTELARQMAEMASMEQNFQPAIVEEEEEEEKLSPPRPGPRPPAGPPPPEAYEQSEDFGCVSCFTFIVLLSSDPFGGSSDFGVPDYEQDAHPAGHVDSLLDQIDAATGEIGQPYDQSYEQPYEPAFDTAGDFPAEIDPNAYAQEEADNAYMNLGVPQPADMEHDDGADVEASSDPSDPNWRLTTAFNSLEMPNFAAMPDFEEDD